MPSKRPPANSRDGRLRRAEWIARFTEARRRERRQAVVTPDQAEKVARRLAVLTREHGGPGGLRAWLGAVWAGRPPRAGMDWGRLADKLTAMARVLAAETGADRERAWAALRALGR